MNRIVREHYPVERLPDDLRRGLPVDAAVRVTVEAATDDALAPRLSMEELRAARRNNFESIEEIVAYVRAMRDD